MTAVVLLERTQEFLRETLLGDQDPDAKVRQLIEAEYLRQVARYRRVDMALTHKYDMSFDDFVARRITRQRGYTWEVEQDAMDWETAVGGMATIERKLKELREIGSEYGFFERFIIFVDVQGDSLADGQPDGIRRE